MIGDWDCDCGRRNSIRHCWCFLCGEPSPAAATVPDEHRAVVADILRAGSLQLSRRYGRLVEIRCLGGLSRMTPDEARALVSETERDLIVELHDDEFTA